MGLSYSPPVQQLKGGPDEGQDPREGRVRQDSTYRRLGGWQRPSLRLLWRGSGEEHAFGVAPGLSLPPLSPSVRRSRGSRLGTQAPTGAIESR